jgi:hypothetical protein
VKIAEGLSRRCPIVSTPFGAAGYRAISGREMLLADSAREFGAACLRILRQPDEAEAMAERGWRVFLEQWTWESLEPKVWQAAEDCLRRSAGAGAAPREEPHVRPVPPLPPTGLTPRNTARNSGP